jgi:hypothetical protein
MSKRSNKGKSPREATWFADALIGLMLAVVVGIMPLVVRIAVRPAPPEIAYYANSFFVDFFSYVKGWLLGIPAVIIAFYYFSDLATGGVMRNSLRPRMLVTNPVLIASVVFIFFTTLSTVFSDYFYTSLHGTQERGEGLLIWLAYLTVFITAMFYVREPKYAKPILWGFVFSSILMGAIGVGQFIGYNFFNTRLATWLVTGGLDIETRFTLANGTLYNPNTFGMYSAMAAPILLITGFTYKGKPVFNYLLLAGGTAMLFGVFGSGSLAGMVGAMAAAGVLLVVSIPMVIRFFGLRTWLMAGAVIVVLASAFIFLPFLNTRTMRLLNRLEATVNMGTVRTRDYRVEGNTLFIIRNGATIATVTPEVEMHPFLENQPGRIGSNLWVTVLDGNGSPLPLTERIPMELEGGEVYHNYVFEIPGHAESIILSHFTDGFIYRNIMLFCMGGQLYGLGQRNEPVDLSIPVPSWGFYGRETWGSSRGFIFSRTFPLMPRYILIGSGPDTYINVFPNDDLFGKLVSGIHPSMGVDKAHNFYLQTWITKGGIAALAMMFIFAHYLFTTFISLIKSKNEPISVYGLRLGLLAGVSAFVVASMSTDSTIGSTGVFFVLLGMGYGLNEWVKRQAIPRRP